MPTLFVYLPCYNEAGNLRRLTEEWLAEAEALARTGYQLTVIPVDDRSTDDTLAIARQLAQEQARVRVIAHAVNQNLGGVVKTAIGDFLQMSQSGDLMCLMDGDDTHKPRFIHGMLAKITREKQCVIASRYQPGARVQGLQASRKLFSDGARLYYTLVLHVPGVKDYTCGYRVYTRPALQAGVARYGQALVEKKRLCLHDGAALQALPLRLYLCRGPLYPVLRQQGGREQDEPGQDHPGQLPHSFEAAGAGMRSQEKAWTKTSGKREKPPDRAMLCQAVSVWCH